MYKTWAAEEEEKKLKSWKFFIIITAVSNGREDGGVEVDEKGSQMYS